MPPPRRKRTPRPPAPIKRNPFDFDPRLNPWPFAPGWMTPGKRTFAPINPGFYPPPQREPPAFGNALGWGGHPGVEGNLFIGKRKAPRTGGWVYGLDNYYPGPRQNPYKEGGPVGRA